MLGPLPAVRDVTARGVRTRVVELGAGPPVLLVHGFLANHHSFDDVGSLLASHYRVIAVDLPGFGESEKPHPSRYAYSVDTFAEVLADVISALQVGRCHLVGHGIGGAVALTLATDHAEFVDHLVLVAPHIFPPARPFRWRLLLAPLIGGFLFKQLFGRSMLRNYFQHEVYAPGHDVPPERVDGYYQCFNSPAARESAHSVLRAWEDTRAIIARLTRVRAPSLVVWGRADMLLSPLDAPKLVRQIPVSRMEYLDAGHAPHEEQPDLFARMVERFFQRS